MKPLRLFYLTLVFPVLVFAQPSTHADFFSSPQHIGKYSRWFGKLSDGHKIHIANIPTYIYQNDYDGYCRIICFPNDPEKWKSKLSGKTVAQISAFSKITVSKILADSDFQKEFKIYSFFTVKEDVITQSDGREVVKVPKFPGIIYVYRKVSQNWVLIKQVQIKDWTEYARLQYAVATNASYPVPK